MNISKRFKKKTVLEKSLKEEAEYKAQLEALRLDNGASGSPPKTGSGRRPLPTPPFNGAASPEPVRPASRGRLGSSSSNSAPPQHAPVQEIIYDSGPVKQSPSEDNMGVVYHSSGILDARQSPTIPQDMYQTVSKASALSPPPQPMYQTISRKPQPAPVEVQPEYREVVDVQQGRNDAPVYETVEAKSRRLVVKPKKDSNATTGRARHISNSSDDVFATSPAGVEYSVREMSPPAVPTISRRRTNSSVSGEDEDEQSNVRKWMKVAMERGDAQAILERYGGADGCYLLRKSAGGSFGLSICASKRVFHMKIMMVQWMLEEYQKMLTDHCQPVLEPTEDFRMIWYIHGDKDGGREFDSLWELLVYYKNNVDTQSQRNSTI